ncbi:MAG: phosphoesterase, partial [Actinomycetes bacterium]
MNVTRQRRRPAGILASKRLRFLAAAGCALALSTGGLAVASTVGFGSQRVGSTSTAGLQISDNQVIKPIGTRLMTPFGKIMGSTISPDGRFVAATSTDRSVTVQVFDMSTYKPVSAAGSTSPIVMADNAKKAGFPSLSYINAPAGQTSANTCTKAAATSAERTVGQGDPTFSPDGSKLYVPVACGLDVYTVDAAGKLSAPTSIFLPVLTAAHPIITVTSDPFTTITSQLPLVAGSAFGPDGHLYAALNGQDAVDEIDPVTGTVLNQWKVDAAPRQLAFVDGKLYVTNEGGLIDESGQQSYATMVKADDAGSTTTGTVSVIDPAITGAVAGTIQVGLHPTALRARGTTLYVANTNDDTVSVIDTTRSDLAHAVVQTISTQPWDRSAVGYEPNALDVFGNYLLVSLGRANAIQVIRLGAGAQDPVSQIGLLPTDYYPSGVFTDLKNNIVVANRRGIDARAAVDPATNHGTHSTTASLTRFQLPSETAIRSYGATVARQNGWSDDGPLATSQNVTTCKLVTKKVKLKGKALKKAKKHHKKRFKRVKQRVCHTTVVPIGINPIPQRIGTKSTAIKHVFLIVKENRTYDQVFGDVKTGNGNATLAQFGARITPNQHALATQFGLYDNTYDIGTNSAEGHNWMMMGDNPEYAESQAGENIRSYDTEEDALGHQRSGFLWNAVEAAGNSVGNYGEFLYGEGKPEGPTWQDYYCAATSYRTSGDASRLTAGALGTAHYGSVIPSLDEISNPVFAPFDLHVPDIYREAVWHDDFTKQAATGSVPALSMLWLSSDHTGGAAGAEAMVADNDLALGRIVDTISHSPIWKDSAIFVAEDDSQAGVDHVDGHRAPIQVVSPYAVHGKTV